MSLPLGKKPATKDDRDFRFSTFVDVERVLPKVPSTFGHERSGITWPMFGNDRWGCCVWTGAAHETRLYFAARRMPIPPFRTEDVLADYSAGTGFDPSAGPPGRNPTDQGTNMREALNYRRHTGIRDATGARHKIGAFMRIDEWQELLVATYLFGAAAIGVEFTTGADRDFAERRTWYPHRGDEVLGGHYLPVVARRRQNRCVTWAQEVGMAKAYWDRYCDEAYAVLSEEYLTEGRTPEGFERTQLLRVLSDLGA